MSPSLPPYTHTPLSGERSFRLLRLEPSLRNDSSLRGGLLELTLDDATTYEALSYCWGPTQPPGRIICDGKELNITHNCAAALRRLRYKAKRRVLWIDAICIDQKSDADKDKQIPMMGDIYGQASRVLVWLREGCFATNVALSRLNIFRRLDRPVCHRIALSMQKLYDYSTDPSLPSDCESEYIIGDLSARLAVTKAFFQSFPAFSNAIGVFKDTMEGRSCWKAVLASPWFNRTWVLQEVALAKQVVILCGSKRACWEDFLQLAGFIDKFNFYDTIHTTNTQTDQALSLYLKIHALIRGKLQQGKNCRTTSDILLLTQYFRVTKPQDKLYALFSIFKALGVDLPLPDQSASIAIIYRQACQAIMLHDNSLKLLGAVHGLRTVTNLQSWVPDFSVEDRPLAIGMEQAHYCASGISEPVFHFSDSGTCLHLCGISIDQVTSCGSAMKRKQLSRNWPEINSYEDDDFLFELEFCHWTSISQQLSTYPTGDTVKFALLRTLYRTLLGNVSSGLEQDFYRVLENVDEVSVLDNRIRNEGDLLSTLAIPRVRALQSIAMWLHLCNFRLNNYTIEELCFQQTFFLTNSGYMGLGAIGLRPRDLVCLIKGCTFPLLLRPVCNRSYAMVGPAYIYGMMSGELWEEDRGYEKFEIS